MQCFACAMLRALLWAAALRTELRALRNRLAAVGAELRLGRGCGRTAAAHGNRACRSRTRRCRTTARRLRRMRRVRIERVHYRLAHREPSAQSHADPGHATAAFVG